MIDSLKYDDYQMLIIQVIQSGDWNSYRHVLKPAIDNQGSIFQARRITW